MGRNKQQLLCRKFRDNEVRLQLHALACNLASFMGTLALPEEVGQCYLTAVCDKLVKIGAKAAGHGRCVIFQLTQVRALRKLLQKILSLISDQRRRLAPA